MMLQIDKARQLVDKLLDRGWRRLGHKTFDNHPYYVEGPYAIAVGQNIRLNPTKTVQENIDSYFKRMMSRMIKYGVKKFIVFGSVKGIPLPKYFEDFCIQNGIEIIFESDEDEMDEIIKKIEQW